jgi:cobalamin biosynthesis Mg chelatase CobN
MTTENQIGDATIEAKYSEQMQAMASVIDEFLNGKDTPKQDKKIGFILQVYPLETHEGRCNYISNAERKDVLVMLKEQVARFEGQAELKGNA